MFIGLGVAVATLGLVFMLVRASGNGQTEHHRDGEGPLASTGDPLHHEASAFDAVKGGPAWTLGYQLCLFEGDQPAIIESVTPTRTVGDGFGFLGARVRQFSPTAAHTPILSLDGYPPALPDTLQPAKGFSVTTPCSKTGPPSTYTELLIGFGRVPAPGGGGWRGIDVRYTAGGRSRVVTLGYDILICGSAVTDEPHLCGSSAASSPSSG